MKLAILQVADSGPLESLIIMLRSVGYQCFTPDEKIKSTLRNLGCDTVLDISGLVRGWGYEKPIACPEATLDMMNKVDLYVDVKAHRSGEKIWSKFPYLQNKTSWYRINGGEPEIVYRDGVSQGDEINPPCPVITPNRWYKEKGPWSDKAYSCWPPFYRFDEYLPRHTRVRLKYDPPMCLIHNINGWGYEDFVPRCRDIGIKCYGAGSPDGLVNHSKVPEMLSRTIAMVHLKDSDAPGYALYEALAAGCPLIVSRTLIWRSHMEELLIPGETCLAFGQPSHASLTSDGMDLCLAEIQANLTLLSNPEENQRIGINGRLRLQELMWSESNMDDKKSFREFMQKHFPGE